MKKIITSLLLIASVLTANAQATGLDENFDATCASGSGFPLDWTSYNPISATVPDGAWTCAPGSGRYGTNGIKCTGIWGSPSAYHLDTAYLISPALNFSGDGDDVFLYFDSKVSRLNLGARLSCFVTPDSTKLDSLAGATEVTGALSPIFSNDDSTDWVTHIADLTPFKGVHPLYVAFRYTSTTTTGSTWYIDNVHKSTFPVGFTDLAKEVLSLNVIGKSTSSTITLSYEAGSPGLCELAVYDLMGRQLHLEQMMLQKTKTTHTISGLDLAPGMYLVKMRSGAACTTVKTIVQ